MITLQVNGTEMIFTKEELERIVGEYYKENEAFWNENPENRWIFVNPKAINKNLFTEERIDKIQEAIRVKILKSFKECREKDGFYAKTNRIFFDKKFCGKLYGIDSKYEYIFSYIEQHYLYLAQRISQGESWEEVSKDVNNMTVIRSNLRE